MADKIIQISIPADEDGYVSFECPHCEQRFKLRADELEESDIIRLFCPKCGLAHELDHFYSKVFIEKAMNIAEQEAMEMIYGMFKGLEKNNRGNNFVKLKTGSKPRVDIKEIFENIDELVEDEMKCCNKHLKVTELDKLIGIYCSYCGVKKENE